MYATELAAATMPPVTIDSKPPKRCHRCGRRHLTWRTLAECQWPRSLWVMGNGRYASLSCCGQGLTIMLHGTKAEAEEAKRGIDRFACGGQCCNLHWTVDLAVVRRRN